MRTCNTIVSKGTGREILEYSQAQGLPADSVQERNGHDLVVRDLGAAPLLDLEYLRAQLRLDVLMLAQQIQHARDGVRRGVHARDDEGAA